MQPMRAAIVALLLLAVVPSARAQELVAAPDLSASDSWTYELSGGHRGRMQVTILNATEETIMSERVTTRNFSDGASSSEVVRRLLARHSLAILREHTWANYTAPDGTTAMGGSTREFDAPCVEIPFPLGIASPAWNSTCTGRASYPTDDPASAAPPEKFMFNVSGRVIRADEVRVPAGNFAALMIMYGRGERMTTEWIAPAACAPVKIEKPASENTTQRSEATSVKCAKPGVMPASSLADPANRPPRVECTEAYELEPMADRDFVVTYMATDPDGDAVVATVEWDGRTPDSVVDARSGQFLLSASGTPEFTVRARDAKGAESMDACPPTKAYAEVAGRTPGVGAGAGLAVLAAAALVLARRGPRRP